MYCKNCVMDTTDKDITFDMEGVCNHCREYVVKEKQRKLDKCNLPWIIYELKKKGCLLGLSGGVDSSMCLYLLKEQGVTPFCFSMDNGWNEPTADENIMRLVEGMKVPFEKFIIDLDKFKELQNAFIMSGVPNIEVCTDNILRELTYKYAVDHKIKYIISGGNISTESIMPESWGYNAEDGYHIKKIYRLFIGKRLKGLPICTLWKYIYYRFIKGIKIINLLDYYEYNRNESIKLLNEKFGYKDYGEKHGESKFTKWFQNYYLPQIHGIDKRKAHLSSLILSKQIKRNEALELLQLPLEYDKIIELQNNFKAKSHFDYPNQKWLWNLLKKLYAKIK